MDVWPLDSSILIVFVLEKCLDVNAWSEAFHFYSLLFFVFCFFITQAAKMANYAKCQILCNLLFAMFAILFISSRLGVYPLWYVLFFFPLTTVMAILLSHFRAAVIQSCICLHEHCSADRQRFKSCTSDS